MRHNLVWSLCDHIDHVRKKPPTHHWQRATRCGASCPSPSEREESGRKFRPASPSHLHSLPIVHCCRRRPLIDLGGACLASHSHGMAWQTDSISLLLNGEGSTGAPPFRPLYLFARTADVLRNVSHTIRTINNDYNGRYGRPIVWKERAREHATGPNQTKSCSSLLFPSLSLSVGVRTKIGSPPPPPFLSLPLAFRRRRAQRERCPNTKRNVIIHS